MSENREYKSAVFSMLMEDKANALQVYNALNGSSYDDPEKVEIVNLESGISLSIRNDAAFIVDADINIYEHQSTYNPNMPLRSLIYYVSILKKLIKDQDIYGSAIIHIPTPHFVVFYNGTKNRPDKEVMKLSSSYEKRIDIPELELKCTVYNINPGSDRELLQKCSVLDEYTRFVEAIRKNEREGIENPIEVAIEYCIENHILERFLIERGTEVLNVMAIDMTYERRVEIIRNEADKRVEEEKKRTAEEKKRADELEKAVEEANDRISELESQLDEIKKRFSTKE